MGVKRTLIGRAARSANDSKRTFARPQLITSGLLRSRDTRERLSVVIAPYRLCIMLKKRDGISGNEIQSSARSEKGSMPWPP
jgi:hypothetical protein